MYIAMNRFTVKADKAEEFEAVWLGRDSHLKGLPGFVEFHMLKGPQADDHILYASHTVWQSEDDFRAWTRSEAFREAHKGAGKNAGLYDGPPKFEGFSAIQRIG